MSNRLLVERWHELDRHDSVVYRSDTDGARLRLTPATPAAAGYLDNMLQVVELELEAQNHKREP